MKRNIIAIACAAVIVAAIAVPVGLQHAPKPESALQQSMPATQVAADEPTEDKELANLAQESQPDESNYDTASGIDYEPGVVLVGLEDGVTADQLNDRLASLDYIATKSISEEDIVFGFAELQLANGVSVSEAETMLADEDIVSTAQPNYIYHIADSGIETAGSSQNTTSLAPALITQSTSVNDPYASEQWGLSAIKAYKAWDTAKVNGAVTVAVLDSGIDSSHEDFSGTKIVGGYSFVNSNARNYNDEFGHGTNVAGIISATANNGTGIAGVSYNAKIMPVQVTDRYGSTSSTALSKAMNYVVSKAATYNVKVLNISIGSNGEAGDVSDAVYDAAVSAVHDAGILVVYAAGNGAETGGGAYNCYPCDYDYDEGAIGVISIDNTSPYTRSSFSNYNLANQVTKELCAPGSSIYTTSLDGSYEEGEGTSFAAPYVSGVAALMFAHDSSLTPTEVRNALCNTTTDLNTSGWDNKTGYGLINASAAFTGSTERPSSDIVSIKKATITLSKMKLAYTGTYRKPAVTVKMHGVTLKKGTDYTVKYSNNLNVGKATVTITGKGNYTGSTTKKFTIVKAPLSSLKLSFSSTAYNGSKKTPTAKVLGVKNGKSNQKLTRNTDYTITVPSGRKAVGTYTYKAVGTGSYKGTVKATLTIKKAKNTMTTKVTAKSVKASQLKKAKKVVKAITIKTPKGTVAYSKTSGSKYLTVNKKTGKITIKKGTAKGTYKIKVRVRAAGNKSYKALSKTVTVKITVK